MTDVLKEHIESLGDEVKGSKALSSVNEASSVAATIETSMVGGSDALSVDFLPSGSILNYQLGFKLR